MVFKVVTDLENFKNELLHDTETQRLKIAYFTASWCGPCKAISPIIQKIGEEKDSLVVLKVDVDECSDVADYCDIDCMPTFFFYNGNTLKPAEKYSGSDLTTIQKHILNNIIV